MLATPAVAPPAARATEPVIYKWVDEHGVAHYTTDRERIPARIRDRVVDSSGERRSSSPDWLTRDTGAAPPTPPAPEARSAPVAEPDAGASPPPGSSAAAEPGDAVHAVPVESPYATAPGAPPPEATEAAVEAARAAAVPEVGAGVGEAGPELGSAATAAEVGTATGETAPAPPPVSARPADPATAARLAELDGRIATLEAEIARDEEALMQLIGASDAERRGPLVDDPKFREIAQRLPRLQADLETLRERRARIEPTAVLP